MYGQLFTFHSLVLFVYIRLFEAGPKFASNQRVSFTPKRYIKSITLIPIPLSMTGGCAATFNFNLFFYFVFFVQSQASYCNRYTWLAYRSLYHSTPPTTQKKLKLMYSINNIRVGRNSSETMREDSAQFGDQFSLIRKICILPV